MLKRAFHWFNSVWESFQRDWIIKMDATKKKDVDGSLESNKKNLQKVGVDVELILATARLKMKDFLNLKLGDVIATDTAITSEAELLVAGKRKFVCRPGLFGKRRAGQIIDIHPIMKEEL